MSVLTVFLIVLLLLALGGSVMVSPLFWLAVAVLIVVFFVSDQGPRYW